MEIFGLIAVILVLYVLAGLAAIFGRNTRKGDDWMGHRKL